MCPLAAGLGREGEGRNEGDQGKKKKERIKTLPCGQHCPSGIRDAHVVRKIILSLTKQEEGAGMEESDRSKQKVPQGFQSAGFKKKKKIASSPPPFSAGELAPSLSPQPPPPKGMGLGREQKVCLEFHIPSILLPQC